MRSYRYAATHVHNAIWIYIQGNVRKTAKIRKRYNQLPHLTQDVTWESNKNTMNIKSQEYSPSQAGDHNAAMNRRESMRNTRHEKTNDPKRSTALKRSVKYFAGGLKPVSRCQPHH